MATITIPARIGAGFGNGISEFLKVLGRIRNLPPNEPIELVMSECKFLTPFFVLPFVLLIKQESESREIICNEQYTPGFVKYADLISFYKGLKPENIMGGDYESYLDKYATKTFIPIIDFPAARSPKATDIRDTFLDVVNALLKKQLNLTGGILTAIYYLIDESINNIVDHSTAERGFIFAQYYPSRQYVDICIADIGIGILETYRKRGNKQILTHRDAIENAGRGVSTKELPAAESRGFGISTSKEMLVDGLNGKYLLMSGNAILVKVFENEYIIESPDELRWAGTIVALRVPYVAEPTFNPALYYQ